MRPRVLVGEVDRLPLGDDHALVVREDDGELRADPWVVAADRRAVAGDGASEALLRLLAGGSRRTGRFTVTSWGSPTPAGERGFGVDQTNDSVVVGEQGVVKWLRVAEPGPHPAPGVLATLREQGFDGVPRPWGVVQWHGPDDTEPRLLVSVDALVPDAEDGWTWAVDDLREAVASADPAPLLASGDRVGTLVAGLHAALAGTARPATEAEVRGWQDDALADLDRALALTTGTAHVLLSERAEVVRSRVVPPPLERPTVMQAHGDLHVGQLLRSPGTLVVTDFDGNPVVPPGERTRPQPAALDVAGMTQSLQHAAYVLRRHEPHHPAPTVAAASDAFVNAFLAAYERGAPPSYDARLVPGLRLRQVCREFSYAAVHLPRWSYVPEAAIVDLVPMPEEPV